MTALDRRGEALVHRLGGTWKHGGGMCRCPAHEDRSPSLSVRVGDSALLFKCFGGCTIAEILRALRRDRIDISGRPDSGHRAAAHSQQRSTAALRLWREAGPIKGTPAARYLAGRRIHQTSHALRFHGSTPLGAGGNVRFLPALLAAVVEGDDIVAVQRIFLQPNGRPALLVKFKRTLGSPRAGAVRLRPAQTVLGLAEGIENAASAGTLLGIPVWATLGAERFDKIAIPQSVKRLVLLADNDRAGRRAVAKAIARYMRPERQVLTLWPPAPFNDWNELHRAGGEVVVERARLAA